MNIDCETSNQRELRRGYAPLSVVAQEPPNRWFQVVARLCSALTLRLPVGYQDERGFHYGVPPLTACRLGTSPASSLF